MLNTERLCLLDLFAPLRLRTRIAPSRIFFAPINTGYCRDGAPSTALLGFHKARSGPAVGINFVGNVSVTGDGKTNDQTLVLNNRSKLSRYAALRRAAAEGGSLAGIQLAYSPPDLQPPRRWATTSRVAERDRLADLVRSMPTSSIEAALSAFVNTTELASSAGFDVIQLHAAHGYFLSLLLNPLTNRRSDSFRPMGSWLRPFLTRVRTACRDAVLSIRLSIFSGLVTDVAEESACTLSMARELAAAGTDILDLSAGFYTVNKGLIYPPLSTGTLPHLQSATHIAQNVPSLVSSAGNVTDLRSVPPLLPNMAVSIGRALIADSNFAEKSKAGLFDQIVSCERTGHCHYFTRGRMQLECGVNSNLARIL
jgi:2,4-dienoyl-CoA reductase-like NADH-dependent reductase (Old Yellow Enzyme family)